MSHERLMGEVELFYKLAVYNKRGDYLRVLGQGAGSLVDRARPLVRAFVQAVAPYAGQANARVQIGQLNTLANQVEQGGQTAREALSQILAVMTQVRAALGASPVDGALAQHMADLQGILSGAAAPQTQYFELPEVELKDEIPTINVEDLPKAPVAPKYPLVARETQSQLNDLLIPLGKLTPPGLDVDGSLGPETQKAMKAFTDEFKMLPTPANIKAVYFKQKGLSETKTPF